MAVIDVHINDPEFEFEWEFNPRTDFAGALPFGNESESESKVESKAESLSDRMGTGSGGQSSTPSAASKLGSFGLVALAVVGAVAFRRLRSRRAYEAAETESESGGRRLSLSRWK